MSRNTSARSRFRVVVVGILAVVVAVAISRAAEAAPGTVQPGPSHPTAGKVLLGVGAGLALATVAATVIARQYDPGREDGLIFVVPLFSSAAAALVSLVTGVILLTRAPTAGQAPASHAQIVLTDGPRGSTVGAGFRVLF